MTSDVVGFAWEYAPGIPEAVEFLKRSHIDAAVVCLPMPEWTAPEVLEQLQQADGCVPLVFWDQNAVLENAIRLVKLGASDVLGPDAEPAMVARAIESAVEYRRSLGQVCETSDEPWKRSLVGSSRPFQDVVRMVRLVANRRCTVLLTGETGTGKEMVARAVHMAGPRRRLPMVSVSCAAIPENLLEAELFGHVRGAFTGAINQRIGRFEQANGSTLFLDEIGDMPLELQAKLLRVLQEREFQRLGSSETIRTDVRIVAATNVDLLEKVNQGQFREDLYYRLNIVPIHLPPLRERSGDIPVLTHHFVGKICRLEDIPVKTVCREALERLARYSWPGNVRQLENAVERAVVMSGERDTLYPADFPVLANDVRRAPERNRTPFVHVPDCGLDFDQTVGQIARSIIEQALRKTNGNKKLAADMLRLKRTTLSAKLRSLETGDSGMAMLESDFVHSA
jgi:DNA-binding NtrC family response regulator